MPSSRTIGLLLTTVVALLPVQPQTFDLAIRDARLVHGDGRVTPRATVLIAGGRVRRIADRSTARATRVIDARGRTLIPGLIDAHVHLEPWSLPLFLRYGVTTVRDVHNDPRFTLALAGEDDVRGRPRVVAAGPLIDGPGSFWPDAVVVDDVGEARAAVRRLITDGAGVIKTYSRLPPSLLAVVVQEARARGVPVAAHLGRTSAVEAAGLGVTSIEHLTGVPESASRDSARLLGAHDGFFAGWTAFELAWPALQEASLERVVRQLVDHQVVIVPTLALHEAYSRLADPDLQADPALRDVPRDVLARWDPLDLMRRARWDEGTLAGFNRALPALQRFVAMYARAGGRIAAGTDSAQQFVVPGASLHRELELYVGAGLSPHAALQAATSEAADLLGLGGRLGTIVEGHDADLVLLDGDPLADIRATRRIAAVIQGGLEVRR